MWISVKNNQVSFKQCDCHAELWEMSLVFIVSLLLQLLRLLLLLLFVIPLVVVLLRLLISYSIQQTARVREFIILFHEYNAAEFEFRLPIEYASDEERDKTFPLHFTLTYEFCIVVYVNVIWIQFMTSHFLTEEK